ncbi:lung cancer oncogene 5 [Brachionus plicatilis]|uniref:Lung cancer oncogene 5 n=1 Tax=Brachionus plicatilis TaxID=10195 RepID=A0A3M7SVY0_BRAPC|nr:lung cancer oncogene 5 [Brachionus plicatilis]
MRLEFIDLDIQILVKYFHNCQRTNNLTRFEQQNGNLSQVEIDKVFGLVGNVTAEVASNNAMPCWIFINLHRKKRKRRNSNKQNITTIKAFARNSFCLSSII